MCDYFYLYFPYIDELKATKTVEENPEKPDTGGAHDRQSGQRGQVCVKKCLHTSG